MNFIDDRLAFSTVFCTHALSFIYKIHFYIHPRQIILAYSWTAWLLTCRLDYTMYCIIKVLLYNISLHFDFFFLTLKTVVPGGSTPPPLFFPLYLLIQYSFIVQNKRSSQIGTFDWSIFFHPVFCLVRTTEDLRTN